jgi:uncharacterized protein
MNPTNGTLRVAAVGDLHVHELPHGAHRDLFLRISQTADVLLLCGDLTNVGTPEEARTLAEDLHILRIPVLAVLGNHDHHTGHGEEVRRILKHDNVIFLDEEPFELEGVGFAGVKGFCGGFEKRMLAPFGEGAIKEFVSETVREALNLENALKMLDTKQTLVILHYSPIAATLVGEPPEIFPFLGSSRLMEPIDRYNVTAVFHGHAHRGTREGKTDKGVPVYNCSYDLLRKHQPEHPFLLLNYAKEAA